MMIAFVWGVAAGACGVLLLIWVPIGHRMRLARDYRDEVARITGGFVDTGESRLNDGAGALAQAKAARHPDHKHQIYPGRRREPDEAWVAWIEGTQRAGLHRAPEPDEWENRQDALTTHQWPSWGSAPSAAVPTIPPPPAAGTAPAPTGWGFSWSPSEFVAAWLVLSVTAFERTALAHNRRVCDRLNGGLLAAGALWSAAYLRVIWLARQIAGGPPSARPKRHYYSPIKEG
jgi:hypothetical protein